MNGRHNVNVPIGGGVLWRVSGVVWSSGCAYAFEELEGFWKEERGDNMRGFVDDGAQDEREEDDLPVVS